jgi:hypothetical protein
MVKISYAGPLELELAAQMTKQGRRERAWLVAPTPAI